VARAENTTADLEEEAAVVRISTDPSLHIMKR
jgi:hypothetical protein